MWSPFWLKLWASSFLDRSASNSGHSHAAVRIQWTRVRLAESMEPTEILKMGGAGNKVLQLIENNAHAYIFASPGCKKWDTCAPQAVLEALGGSLTDVNGNLYEYHKDVSHPNKGGVIAAVSDIDFYLSKIPSDIKEKLKY